MPKEGDKTTTPIEVLKELAELIEKAIAELIKQEKER